MNRRSFLTRALGAIAGLYAAPAVAAEVCPPMALPADPQWALNQWGLYPPGPFLYLDGGALEVGVIRQSVMNVTNDYVIFGERGK